MSPFFDVIRNTAFIGLYAGVSTATGALGAVIIRASSSDGEPSRGFYELGTMAQIAALGYIITAVGTWLASPLVSYYHKRYFPAADAVTIKLIDSFRCAISGPNLVGVAIANPILGNPMRWFQPSLAYLLGSLTLTPVHAAILLKGEKTQQLNLPQIDDLQNQNNEPEEKVYTV